MFISLFATLVIVANLFFWFFAAAAMPRLHLNANQQDHSILDEIDLEAKQQGHWLKKMAESLFAKKVFEAVCVASLIVFGYWGNAYFQLYCQPATWASFVLLGAAVLWVLLPVLHQKSKILDSLLALGLGAATCIAVYCLWFAGFFLVASLAVFLLVMSLCTLLIKSLLETQSNLAIRLLISFVMSASLILLAPALPILMLAYSLFYFVKYGIAYKIIYLAGFAVLPILAWQQVQQYKTIKDFVKNRNRVGELVMEVFFKRQEDADEYQSENISLLTSYMGECIMGEHFKYHTEMCLYDGWRPPLHDPFLVVSRWYNGGTALDSLGLEDRINVYRLVFPEEALPSDCACAKSHSEEYFNSSLFDSMLF